MDKSPTARKPSHISTVGKSRFTNDKVDSSHVTTRWRGRKPNVVVQKMATSRRGGGIGGGKPSTSADDFLKKMDDLLVQNGLPSALSRMGRRMDVAEGMLMGEMPMSLAQSLGVQLPDELNLLDGMSESAVGRLNSPLGENSMDMLKGLASGKNQDDISTGILGEIPQARTSGSAAAASAMGAVASAAGAGVGAMATLKSVVGLANGAQALLNATIQNAIDKKLALMMGKIMTMIKKAHVITHPLFLTIFPMTWNENGQWKPDWPVSTGGYLEIVKEIPEYFDFIQKVMGGAIGEICGGMDKMFQNVCSIGKQIASGQVKVSVNASVNVYFPTPPLSVPLMSISKQIEDVLNKIMIIKEIVRQMARQIIEKIKSLEAPQLFINMPGDFFEILEVLVEAYFIYANLPIVLDKILIFFINMFVEKFAGRASEIIDKLFGIWEKVVEIVPPLDDLLKLAWAIPNAADFCVNVALNIALPDIWGMVKPYVMLPFQAIDMIEQACDEAIDVAYAIPPP